MEGLVKLSFYCFAASSIAIGFSALAYAIFGVGRVRFHRTVLTTSAGTTISGTSAQMLPGSMSAGRFGTMLGWLGVFFAGCAVLTRTIASHRGPYSNMYEFSLAFIFAGALIYLLFERMYKVRQLGAIVLPIVFGMTLYIWYLPANMREIDGLNPSLQNQPLMTAHVSMAILSYATFAISFAAAALYLIQSRRKVSWPVRRDCSRRCRDQAGSRRRTARDRLRRSLSATRPDRNLTDRSRRCYT